MRQNTAYQPKLDGYRSTSPYVSTMETQVGTLAGRGVPVADGAGSVGLGIGIANMEYEDEALTPGCGVGGAVGGAHGFTTTNEGGVGAAAINVRAHASTSAAEIPTDRVSGLTAAPRIVVALPARHRCAEVASRPACPRTLRRLLDMRACPLRERLPTSWRARNGLAALRKS